MWLQALVVQGRMAKNTTIKSTLSLSNSLTSGVFVMFLNFLIIERENSDRVFFIRSFSRTWQSRSWYACSCPKNITERKLVFLGGVKLRNSKILELKFIQYEMLTVDFVIIRTLWYSWATDLPCDFKKYIVRLFTRVIILQNKWLFSWLTYLKHLWSQLA